MSLMCATPGVTRSSRAAGVQKARKAIDGARKGLGQAVSQVRSSLQAQGRAAHQGPRKHSRTPYSPLLAEPFIKVLLPP